MSTNRSDFDLHALSSWYNEDMSGHSKWNNIKNKKGVADIKKGKLFSQLSKNIRITVKEGKSGDPKFNASLRLALEKARAANMPKENIDRAIERGLGHGKAGAIQEVIYEGYAPGGIGLLIVAQSDNMQRTAGEVRSILSKAGGTLSGPGTVMYMFQVHGNEYTVILPIEVSDGEKQAELEKLIETLQENEDVEDVYSTAMWEGKDAPA